MTVSWKMNISSDTCVLFMNRAVWDGAEGIEVFVKDGRLHARGSGPARASSNSADYDGSWVHAAVVFHGASVSFYRNGREDGGGKVAPVVSSSHELIIGGYGAGCRYSVRGVLDDVQLYDRTLSADEIRELAMPGK
jgi:hypothetical protein